MAYNTSRSRGAEVSNTHTIVWSCFSFSPFFVFFSFFFAFSFCFYFVCLIVKSPSTFWRMYTTFFFITVVAINLFSFFRALVLSFLISHFSFLISLSFFLSFFLSCFPLSLSLSFSFSFSFSFSLSPTHESDKPPNPRVF